MAEFRDGDIIINVDRQLSRAEMTFVKTQILIIQCFLAACIEDKNRIALELHKATKKIMEQI